MAKPEFTARERDVLCQILGGGTNRDIADALDISVETVRTYVRRLRDKLNSRSKVTLALWAERNLGRRRCVGCGRR